MVHIIQPQPSPVASGWSCPQCGGVWAPWVQACQNCPPGIRAEEDAVFADPDARTVPLRDSQLFRHSFGGAPRPREGGGCSCVEPAGGPVLRLPPYMANEGAYQVSRLGAGFTEIFPGLEAAVFWPADDDGKLVAHFRLTPPDGQADD